MFRIIPAIILLLLSFVSPLVWGQYNSTQDIQFTEECVFPGNKFNSQSVGPLASVTVDMTHDIVDNVDAAAINNDCKRYVYFDVYAKGPGGTQIYEATISKSNSWLYQGVNSQSSTVTYDLDPADMDAAGVSGGKKYIHLRVRYDHYGDFPTTINRRVEENGSLVDNAIDVEGTDVTYNFGQIKCLSYFPCDADVVVSTSVELKEVNDGINTYTVKDYAFSVSVSGGSGDFIYEWTNNATGATGSGTTFDVETIFPANADVDLQVEDARTGCVYFWNYKRPHEPRWDVVGSLRSELVPQPVAQGQSSRLLIWLPQDDHLEVALYDFSGRHLGQLFAPAEVAEGNLELVIDSELAPGQYFIQIRGTRSGLHTQRMSVLR